MGETRTSRHGRVKPHPRQGFKKNIQRRSKHPGSVYQRMHTAHAAGEMGKGRRKAEGRQKEGRRRGKGNETKGPKSPVVKAPFERA
jgi:hypothetical protein